MKNRELAQILVLANEFKEGDLLVGGTLDDTIRKDARERLAALRLTEIDSTILIEDSVSESLRKTIDQTIAGGMSQLTLEQLKAVLLSSANSNWLNKHRDGLSSEVIAAVVRLMTNEELSYVARSIFNPLPGSGIRIGSQEHFGSRIQPNSPGDDEEEILFSILEGLSYGCGDVILGLNPASDDLDDIVRLEELLSRVRDQLELPTRFCVLSDIVKQDSVRARTPVDVGFQSLAGTAAALNGMVGLEIEGLIDIARGFNGLYFETGQGSAVTNGAAEGVDMVTLESRSYGVARQIRKETGCWMIVNDVAGFIGPEVFRTGEQLLRACLEDSVMAKLHGLTIGLDVCSTFHMGIAPGQLHEITARVVEMACPAYLMAVAGNADPMLGYLTTSFREHPALRLQEKKRVASPMQSRLEQLGVMDQAGDLLENRSGAASLYAAYEKAGGDTRPFDSLVASGEKKLRVLQERGFDLGFAESGDFSAPSQLRTRIDSIYGNARKALYAQLEDSVIRDSTANAVRVKSEAINREDYLSHPASGEIICKPDAAKIRLLYPERRPAVQFAISDGLNANAVNLNLREVLPQLRRSLIQSDFDVGEFDVVITNGRVRAGYYLGSLLDVPLIVHFIGERPGTGIDMLSIYLTYGRDSAGHTRWNPGMDHSVTTAICGIHRKGKPPIVAVEEAVACVKRIFDRRASGVELGRRKTDR